MLVVRSGPVCRLVVVLGISLLVGAGCGIIVGSQHGIPESPGVRCPDRPIPHCRSDEQECTMMDRTIGCAYRQCMPPGACPPP